MKIALITDAWRPQINGVVTTLVELVDQLNAKGHVVEVIHLIYSKRGLVPVMRALIWPSNLIHSWHANWMHLSPM